MSIPDEALAGGHWEGEAYWPAARRKRQAMLDHIGLTVSDVTRAQTFYDLALAPLGVSVMVTVSAEQSGGDAHLGYGSDGKAYFWISDGRPLTGRLHVALTAASRAQVDAFYAAALAAGGTDNGPPGANTTIPPTTGRSCWIRTGTTSRPSATCRPEVSAPRRRRAR
jgi:catechol 2,3-dioxygenase-like lactoylglutathione lyase family enzyme